jgi:sugar/nucleoside kinase (ribokinase family)
MLIADLEEVGVRTAIRAVPELESGAVADEISAEGERMMRSSRGANVALSPNDLRNAAGPAVRMVHLTGFALLGPFGVEMLRAAGEVAARSNALLSFDPGSEGVIATIGRERLLDEIAACRIGLLVPNRFEALALARVTDVREAVERLAAVVPAVVVRDGADGAYVSTAGQVRSVPTVPVQPLDTTGAGDGFNAGLLAALQRGLPLEEACLWGHRIARRVISRYGGRPIPGLDRREDLLG